MCQNHSASGRAGCRSKSRDSPHCRVSWLPPVLLISTVLFSLCQNNIVHNDMCGLVKRKTN